MKSKGERNRPNVDLDFALPYYIQKEKATGVMKSSPVSAIIKLNSYS